MKIAAGQRADAHVESRFEKLVRRVHVQPPVERQRDARHPRIEKQPRAGADEQDESVLDRRRRLHQVVDAAVERGHQREADRQPRHRLPREEELVEVRLPAREIDADARHGEQINQDDDDVDGVKRLRHLYGSLPSGARTPRSLPTHTPTYVKVPAGSSKRPAARFPGRHVAGAIDAPRRWYPGRSSRGTREATRARGLDVRAKIHDELGSSG